MDNKTDIVEEINSCMPWDKTKLIKISADSKIWISILDSNTQGTSHRPYGFMSIDETKELINRLQIAVNHVIS